MISSEIKFFKGFKYFPNASVPVAPIVGLKAKLSEIFLSQGISSYKLFPKKFIIFYLIKIFFDKYIFFDFKY